MNFIKKILGYPKGEDPKSDADISTDIFSFSCEAQLVGYNNSEKQEIFSRALVKFLRNPDKLFSYSLYLKNIGKAQQEMAQEYIFPVHGAMNLKSIYENDPDESLSFIWNLDPTNTLCLVFRDENNGLPKAILFKDMLCRLIYETIHSISSINAASDNDFLKYCKEISIPNNSKPQVVAGAQTKSKELIDLTGVLPEFTKKKGTLLCNSGSYYSLDSNETLTLISESTIFVLSDDSNFKYSFSLYDHKKNMIYKKIVSTELNYHIDEQQNLFKWLDFTGGHIQLLAMKFDSFGLTKNLKFLMNQCLFESNRKEYLKDAIKKEDELHFTEKFLAQEPMELEEEVVLEYNQGSNLGIQEKFSFFKNSDSHFNRTFSQAKVLDRTFLSKGPVITVFKTDEDDTNQLDFICDLPELKTLENKPIFPKKVLMHEADTKVLILNENDNKKVFYLDLEKGKVISELQADQANSILDICPEGKHTNLTQNPLFLGLNQKNLFKIDPRLNSKQAAALSKIYSTNNHFNSISTNTQGNFVVGNDLGELRLYKEVGQNAKNLYPGLGDPILGLDCTKDGRWLLATCKNYLLFVPAFHQDKYAFQTTIKNVDKPTPRMLKIHPKDMIKLKIKEVNFTNGHFDDSEKDKEQYIVVGCENFLFTWSIKKVLQGKIFDYEIKKLEDKIVNNEFKFNDIKKMLVALPSELRLHQTKIEKN